MEVFSVLACRRGLFGSLRFGQNPRFPKGDETLRGNPVYKVPTAVCGFELLTLHV